MRESFWRQVRRHIARDYRQPAAAAPEHDLGVEGEDEIAEALKPFGWTCSPGFFDRYYQDPWVFTLTNAVVRLTEERDAARAIRKASTWSHVQEVEKLRAALADQRPVLVDDHEVCSRQLSSVARLAHQVHSDRTSSWRKCLHQVCIRAQQIDADMFLRTVDEEEER